MQLPVSQKNKKHIMHKQIKLLFLHDYNATTGFATVSQNIVAHLKKHFGNRLKLDIIAINFFGEPYQEDENTRVWPAIKMVVPGAGADEFGRHPFLYNLANGEYDGIFIIQDIGIITPIIQTMRTIQKKNVKAGKKKFKSVFYFPIDGPPLKSWFDDLDFFDVPVAYTQYAKKEILKCRPELEKKLQVILHGINTNHFYPLEKEKKERFRKEYFGDNASKFIINASNRNQPRKDFPTLILGFKKYKEQFNPDAFLYLHCNPTDHMGWNLHTVMEQLELKEGVDFVFPPEAYHNAGASIDVLNHIINASDVYITSTMGEGFGYFPIQFAACKVPVIVPYNTSLVEMSGYGRHFFVLKNLRPAINHFDSMVRTQCDTDEIALSLNMVDIGVDLHHGKQMVYNAYEYAQSLSWDIIIKQWIRIFEETFFK